MTSTHDSYIEVVGFAEENSFRNILSCCRKTDQALTRFSLTVWEELDSLCVWMGNYWELLSCTRPSFDTFCVTFRVWCQDF